MNEEQIPVYKCPFRKIINKLHEKTDGIGESFREVIQEEESFADCLESLCMAFVYIKVGEFESRYCKRMGENK